MSKQKLFGFLLLMSIYYLKGQEKQLPETKIAFKKIELLDKYVTEGASVGDMNNDGHVDIIAGSYWWKGPKFSVPYAYAPTRNFPITGPGLEGYADNFFTSPEDFNSDGWPDILRIGLPGTDSKWVKNPGKNPLLAIKEIREPIYLSAQTNVCHESPTMVNVIGDGKKELLAFSKGYLVLGVPAKEETQEWQTLNISLHDPERFPTYSHGLGAGDVNMDGLIDILERSGWWEQPNDWDRSSPWKYHPFPFSPGKGGSQMFAYDVNGDGKNDVVTAMNGHGYGLSWFEQTLEKDNIGFKEHQVMTNTLAGSPYGVCFSQLHAMACADIDGDGILDIVTGKCYYAHNGKDIGAEDPAVLYWFKTARHSDGTAELIPYKIDDDSGVGRQISIGDLNNNGKMDIVVANKKGVFAFIQIKKE